MENDDSVFVELDQESFLILERYAKENNLTVDEAAERALQYLKDYENNSNNGIVTGLEF